MAGRGRGGRGGRGGGRSAGPSKTPIETLSDDESQTENEEAGKKSGGSLEENNGTLAEIEQKEDCETSQLQSLRQQFNQLKDMFEKMTKIEQNHSSEEPVIPSTAASTSQKESITSWKEKLIPKLSQKGMPLKYVPPFVDNGSPIVELNSLDLKDLVKEWEKALVFYVVGERPNLEVVRGFIRKNWNHVAMPIIYPHDDAYFLLKFQNASEVRDILCSGPYFLGRTPVIVKSWSTNFDFYEEVLRVIPVWFHLPKLPLHCWGEESLSRIVSAIGVPLFADDCTSKQMRVSYARVLVEVDITKPLAKHVRIRDSNGKEFAQLVVPEWCPYYCQKCRKVGHVCKDKTQPKTTKADCDGKDEVQGQSKIDDLCHTKTSEQAAPSTPKEQQLTPSVHEHQGDGQWTTVHRNKVARRSAAGTGEAAVGTGTAPSEKVSSVSLVDAFNGLENANERGGIPTNPSSDP